MQDKSWSRFVSDVESGYRRCAIDIDHAVIAFDAVLKKLGIRTYPSRANFILFYAGERAIPIRDALREKGVLIRDRSYEIPGCVRVTIGTRKQMERFLTELESLWTA